MKSQCCLKLTTIGLPLLIYKSWFFYLKILILVVENNNLEWFGEKIQTLRVEDKSHQHYWQECKILPIILGFKNIIEYRNTSQQ